MSAATADAQAAASPGGGKKKLIIIVVAVLVLLLGGGGAYLLLKPKPAAEDGAEDDGHGRPAKAKGGDSHAAAPVAAPRGRNFDPKHPPVFVPLEPFTVNLADRDSERYAQIGVTLEIEDPKFGEELKVFMPAIRNNILIVLSGKTSDKLLSREGKEKLARQILVATVRPLGFPAMEEDDDDEEAQQDEAAPRPRKKRRPQPPMVYPVVAVHFSTFIVQ